MASSSRSVDDIIVAPAPPARLPDLAAEQAAFLGLSEVLARHPEHAVQRLIEAAMKLTQAATAGVSLEDEHEGQRVFRWVAVAGDLKGHLNAVMPREFSPCGTVVERNRTLVMREPVRYFPYAAGFEPPLRSALLSPFGRGGRPVGTVWVISHDSRKTFTTDDVRVVEKLTTFATSLLDVLQARKRKAE